MWTSRAKRNAEAIDDLPEAKRTTLDLYATANEAYAMWAANPQQVHVLDVRTPEEYIFVGHAAMARNVPVVFVEYEWDIDRDQPVARPNPDFVTRVASLYRHDDTLLILSRSGRRSASAVNSLARAGFTNAYTITDGMEGDKVADPESTFLGKRMKNGWKNSESPWTYDCDPELLWRTAGPSTTVPLERSPRIGAQRERPSE